MLYTHKCHKCNYEGSGNFYFAGPHLKQVCGKCGFYIKFADKLTGLYAKLAYYKLYLNVLKFVK